jgi:serine/threonine protein kinase
MRRRGGSVRVHPLDGKSLVDPPMLGAPRLPHWSDGRQRLPWEVPVDHPLKPHSGATRMSTNDGHDVGPEPNGKGAGCESELPGACGAWHDPAHNESGSATSAGTARPADIRVIAALETYLASIRDGRPASRSELLARYADISGALDGCFSGLEFIQAAAAQLSGSPDDPTSTRDEPALPSHSQLGDFQILREVGRGGMGVVYEARQVSLGRRVALKVLPFAAAVDPKQRQRFQIEAQAAAQLHHAHIVPVFGVGCDQGVHYYAMQFVDGHSLATVIRDLRSGAGPTPAWAQPSVYVGRAENQAACQSPADRAGASRLPLDSLEFGSGDAHCKAKPDDDATWDVSQPIDVSRSAPTVAGIVHRDRAFCRKVARLGIEAADALDHAHALGVLHRDIKPANLLIDHHGAVWITDFGLARFSGDPSLTGTGDIVGTLRYMSPEQALARRGVVDQRTDVYALGATLYELLTLRPAFGGRDHQELLRQIALDEPIPPRRLNSAVPRDLETIILKAMAKDPAGRYVTAQELSEDLKRFLNDLSIMGRPPGPIERTVRWARRRWELVATAAAIAVLSLVIGTAVTWRQALEIRRQGDKAREASNKYRDYIVENFPLLDRYAKEQVEKADMMLRSTPDATVQGDAKQVYDQVVRMFQEASQLPPTDKESRVVIARALSRLASTRSMLGLQQGNAGLPDSQLMAAAGSDFRRAIAMFEKLLAEERGDLLIRRYLADALGLGGMGCHMRFTQHADEAERFYRRAIEVRRDLVRGSISGDSAGSRPRIDDPGERENPLLLAYTVGIVASAMEAAGRAADAEGLRRQLEDDFAVLATRFSAPEFQPHRDYWVSELIKTSGPTSIPMVQRMNLQHSRLATILAPKNGVAHNNVAWALARIPTEPWFDPKRGLEEARTAVALEPKNPDFWNTLGVAAFRTRDWTTARDALQKSIKMSGGKAYDWFFLAMTYWNQGDKCEAQKCFDSGVAALKNEKSNEDYELRQFHTEAAALLGVPVPKTGPAAGLAPTGAAASDT